MSADNLRELENGRPHLSDEADSLRRLSPGDENTAAPGGNANINKISAGGIVVALIAFVVALLALNASNDAKGEIRAVRNEIAALRTERAVAASTMAQLAADAARAAERADKAERSAAISRVYAVQVYPQLNRLGFPVLTPADDHEPVPPEAYEDHDNFVSEHSQ